MSKKPRSPKQLANDERLRQKALARKAEKEAAKAVEATDASQASVEEVNPPEAPVEAPERDLKACIFCGEHGRYQRFVNLTYVWLCESDYQDKNIGKIVQKLNADALQAEPAGIN